MTVVDTWLADGALLASIHLPDGPPARRAVVICPPLGQEHIVAYRTLRLLSETLARAGVASIRFSYPGHGDSTEGPWPHGLLEGTRIARNALREHGCETVSYLGLSSGALVASAAASEDPRAAGLVLWDPPISGRHWLRRARTLYATSVAEASLEPRSDGSVPIVGAELTAAEAEMITSFSYDPSLASRIPVLMALRTESGIPRSFETARIGEYDPDGPERWDGSGSLQLVRVEHQEQLLDVNSIDVRIPGSTVDLLSRWCATRSVPFQPPETVLAPTAVKAVVVDIADGPLRPHRLLEERIVRIGPENLFAIETRALDASPDAPAMILHTGSSEHRVGAARHQVVLARELALRGLRVVRVDRRGAGESGPVRADEQSLLYSEEWLEDNRNIIRYLGLPRDLVGITGLCTGAWLALQTDPDQARLMVAVGCNLFRMTPAAPGEIAGLSRDETGNPIPQRPRGRFEAWLKRSLPYPLVLALGYLGKANVPEPLLRRTLAGDTNVVLMMTPDDQQSFQEQWGERALSRLTSARGKLTVVNVDHGDHALFGATGRDQTVREVIEHVERAFGPLEFNEAWGPESRAS